MDFTSKASKRRERIKTIVGKFQLDYMKYVFSNKKLTKRSQHLRRDMTAEERKLWYMFLKNLPCRFRRQKVVGRYIVDFYCAEKKLVIEIDGSEHFEPEHVEKDKVRTEYLNSLGISVLRYANNDVNLRFESVCEDIYRKVSVT